MKIAVLMPCKNGEKTVARAIQSIGQQFVSGAAIHVYFVDNGSTDKTLAVAEDALIDAKLKYEIMKCSAPGIVPALNMGLFTILGKGSYDLVARMDADDRWYPTKLLRQVEYLRANLHCHVLGTQIRLVDTSFNPTGNDMKRPTDDLSIRQMLTQGHNAIAHPSVVVRSEVFLRTGGYDNTYPIAEDYHLWLKALRWFNFANLDEVLMDYTVSHNPQYNPLCPQLACIAMKAALRLQ